MNTDLTTMSVEDLERGRCVAVGLYAGIEYASARLIKGAKAKKLAETAASEHFARIARYDDELERRRNATYSQNCRY